ncbi:hypothetical protein [Solemya elarraichensis gill symbiont]|nr:hypothetical protein [Solemya elarraichensis gill symbiont]
MSLGAITIGGFQHLIEGIEPSLETQIEKQYQGITRLFSSNSGCAGRSVFCSICYHASLDKQQIEQMTSEGWRFWSPLGPIVAIAELEFIVALSPDSLNNRLYIQTPEILLNRIVIENYLRVATAHLLLKQGGCLLHSGGFIHDGLAWLFVGVSGAGKTTLTRIAHEGGATILSDDINVLFRDSEGDFLATPVPFSGEFRRQHNMTGGSGEALPVGGIFRIEKSDKLIIKPLEAVSQQVTLLSNMPFVNNIPEYADNVDAVVSTLANRHPLQTLQFSKELQFNELASGLAKSRMEQQHAA